MSHFNLRPMEIDYFVDTALSTAGSFPVGGDDLYVEIMSPLGDYPVVCVCGRYTSPDVNEAAAIAVDLLDERDREFSDIVHYPSGCVGGRFVHATVYDAAGEKLSDVVVRFDESGAWEVDA